MAGKSTFLRQVAIITILAHIGSFVPAKSATIPITDAVYSRIGAHDNVSKGESTFMVEMAETAIITQNATKNSLVILDEVGRGTSTYDGFSLAWAISEYLLTTKCTTLFATHYHQLNLLTVPGVSHFHSTIKETSEGLIFMRKILSGSTDKSFGIHVAKLAGLPQSILSRAEEIMQTLEEEDDLIRKAKKISPLQKSLGEFKQK